MKIVIGMLLVVTLLIGLGCTSKASTDTRSPEERPVPVSSTTKIGEAASAPVGPAPSSVKGTVLETIDAPGYTYLRLKTAQGEIWAAVTKVAVKKGSEVTIVNATPMDGFESKTLNRKFDHIVFGSLDSGTAETSGLSPLAPGHGMPMDKRGQAAMAEQHAAAASAPVEVGKIEVAKAEGTDGKTVAEIYAGKASLKEATVSVRGKVVKYNPGIMGKNWIHLRDGSGLREKRNDDITVTSLDVTAVGDVILVRGTLHLDRDFGAGYVYPVVIEDAKIVK